MVQVWFDAGDGDGSDDGYSQRRSSLAGGIADALILMGTNAAVSRCPQLVIWWISCLLIQLQLNSLSSYILHVDMVTIDLAGSVTMF